MKLPQIFVPKKKSDKNIERLLEEPKQKENPHALEHLLKSCEEYFKFANSKHYFLKDSFSVSEEVASNLIYTKEDLEDLSQAVAVDGEDYIFLGVHFSTLVNKIIKEEDTITLRFKEKLLYLGSYHGKGTLVIEQGSWNHVGYRMYGGKIIVQGNVEESTGEEMEGGEIVVQGDASDWAGQHMKGGKIHIEGDSGVTGSYMIGGEIHVDGEISHLSEVCKGTIYNKGKKVWPKRFYQDFFQKIFKKK